MSEITIRSSLDVDLIDSMGNDQAICQAARVSTLGAASLDTDESSGLINFLLRNRHGSPFEHGAMSFRVSAPIFVWREFMRHRVGWSYNEQSGRYMQMEPKFYVPSSSRPLVQVGKPGAYEFIPGGKLQYSLVVDLLTSAAQEAWDAYEKMMAQEVAKEVARMCLPVNIYSTAYVTCNPRSMMHFLSLRTKDSGSMFLSFPMWEINQVANKLEMHFRTLFPLTHKAFNLAGRVCP